ncbi:MAG: sorbosone dehydrogenase family protein [Candidatus Omnitrophica bacterium]|nr:sorbosone dehydrogenase family protein [Candidatus Omnitrophota bacterium]
MNFSHLKRYVLCVSAAAFFCTGAHPLRGAAQDVSPEKISLPAGFRIQVYARVPGARSLAYAPSGTLYVGSRGEGKVYAVPDADGDFQADEVVVLAEELFMPNGVAVRDGDLYVAEVHRVIKFPQIGKRLKNPPAPEVVNASFPRETHHGWKFIQFGPDGKLYVPLGAPCNVCVRQDERFASILRMDPDGSALEVFARGIRNTVGFDWHPQTGVLWFTDNGRDWLGDDRPPDELNRAPEKGLHFGFPFCHGKSVADPYYGDIRSCEQFTPPVLELGPHVAALGMRFYTGEMFPEKYRYKIFIAEHGSWNRTVPIGYRVMAADPEKRGSGALEVFAQGWLQNGKAWGRPVDVAVAADGALLISDDHSGTVYRVTYEQDSGNESE